MDRNEVRFKYYFDSDYDPEYVNGAYGGQTPNGELVIHFYMDRFPIPYEVTQGLTEDGLLDEENIRVKPDLDEAKIRRKVKTGVLMSRDTAINIYHWLELRLKEMGVEEDELRSNISSEE